MSRSDKPLHERLGPVGNVRGYLRDAFLEALTQGLATAEGRSGARRALLGAPRRKPGLGLDAHARPSEYPELATAPGEPRTSDRSDIVFVTGRFRSGSTLLWNLFRNVGGFTAYYEPFNERRWFDPSTRGSATDPSHQRVSDYWKEYEGLSDLGDVWDIAFHERDLFLSEDAWWPEMKRFLEILIEKSPARPLIQLNRADFRLPWIRKEFPNAQIVHIYRHPRDQWCSTLMDRAAYSRDQGMAEYPPHDHFYLRLWAQDLSAQFPFLEESRVSHPYELSYFIWKLSYLFGLRFATRSLAFESLVERPRESVEELLDGLGARGDPERDLQDLVVPPPLGRWRDWADDDWFRQREAACEQVLADFLAG